MMGVWRVSLCLCVWESVCAVTKARKNARCHRRVRQHPGRSTMWQSLASRKSRETRGGGGGGRAGEGGLRRRRGAAGWRGGGRGGGGGGAGRGCLRNARIPSTPATDKDRERAHDVEGHCCQWEGEVSPEDYDKCGGA